MSERSRRVKGRRLESESERTRRRAQAKAALEYRQAAEGLKAGRDLLDAQYRERYEERHEPIVPEEEPERWLAGRIAADELGVEHAPLQVQRAEALREYEEQGLEHLKRALFPQWMKSRRAIEDGDLTERAVHGAMEMEAIKNAGSVKEVQTSLGALHKIYGQEVHRVRVERDRESLEDRVEAELRRHEGLLEAEVEVRGDEKERAPG